MVADVGVDALFALDILVHLRTAADERDRLVIGQREIAARYCRGLFWPDLVACLPLQYVALAATGGGADDGGVAPYVWRLLKAPRLLRVGRLFGLGSLTEPLIRRFEDSWLMDKLESSAAKAVYSTVVVS